MAAKTGCGAAFVPGNGQIMHTSQGRPHPIRLLVSPKANENLGENRCDHCGAVVVQQFVYLSFFASLGTIEKRNPNAGVNQHEVLGRHCCLLALTPPTAANCPPSEHFPTTL